MVVDDVLDVPLLREDDIVVFGKRQINVECCERFGETVEVGLLFGEQPARFDQVHFWIFRTKDDVIHHSSEKL